MSKLVTPVTPDILLDAETVERMYRETLDDLTAKAVVEINAELTKAHNIVGLSRGAWMEYTLTCFGDLPFSLKWYIGLVMVELVRLYREQGWNAYYHYSPIPPSPAHNGVYCQVLFCRPTDAHPPDFGGYWRTT